MVQKAFGLVPEAAISVTGVYGLHGLFESGFESASFVETMDARISPTALH
jgi:hypothetical protein